MTQNISLKLMQKNKEQLQKSEKNQNNLTNNKISSKINPFSKNKLK